MLKNKQKYLIKKLFSLFSVVRGYNILVIVIAQYLSSIYILSKGKTLKEVLFDWHLFILVFASSLVIASGYIINNFYDSEKDLINRPNKSLIDRLVSQQTKLVFYFILNFIAVILASYVSFRAVLFFSGYIFLIWFYSHKLKRYLIIGNLVASILAILPFFVVFIHYKNFETVIFVHGIYLLLLLSMRELTKDLEYLKGDLALNYQTIPVVYGIKTSKILLSILIVLILLPVLLLITRYSIGYMHYYFYFSLIILAIYQLILWKGNAKKHYSLLHILLKILIVVGVFCIVFIKPSVITSIVY